MFERLFRKQDIELKVEQINEYLDREFASQKNELETKLKSYAQEIRGIFAQLEEAVNSVSNQASPDKYANTVKNKFCAKATESINSVKNFAGGNRDFINTARQTASDIGSFNLKDFRHLHAFKDDMSRIAEKLKLLDARLGYANKAISSAEASRLDKIIDKINRIAANRSSIADIDQSLKQTSEAESALNISISDLQQKAASLGEEFAKHAEGRLKTRSIEQQQREIESRIDNEFAGLGRIFKKFLYYGDLTKDESHILQEYIRDSGATFLSDDENLIFSVIDKLYAYRDRKTIEMDESKHEKVKDIIRHRKILEELRQRYRQLEHEKSAVEADVESRTAPIMKEISAAKAAAADKQRELNSLRSRIQGVRTEKQTLEKEISSLISSLEFDLSQLLNRNVRIVA